MMISIHAPTNGATIIIFIHKVKTTFQSTLRRTERRRPPEDNIIAPVFQSTLRRTERRIIHILITLYFSISIHAPTNGATP